jgi:hypothetical protein
MLKAFFIFFGFFVQQIDAPKVSTPANIIPSAWQKYHILAKQPITSHYLPNNKVLKRFIWRCG